MKNTKYTKGGQNARHICFESVFFSIVDYYADEEKSSQSTFVSLSPSHSVDKVYNTKPLSNSSRALYFVRGIKLSQDGLGLFSASAVKSVIVAELAAVDSFNLCFRNSESPVSFSLSGNIESRVSSVEKKVLNGKYYGVGVTAEKGENNGKSAFVPVVSVIAAVVEHFSSRCAVNLPYVAEHRLVVVSARIRYAVGGIVVRKVR